MTSSGISGLLSDKIESFRRAIKVLRLIGLAPTISFHLTVNK